jgi:L-serine dehydratase
MGRVARHLLGGQPQRAEILLHGSFAATGAGHGTDRALVAGLLDLAPDDVRLPDSFRLARQAGLEFTFGKIALRDAHPNTALLRLTGPEGRRIQVQASSLGGGRVRVDAIDGLSASFTGELPTLVIRNQDTPGHVSKVSAILSRQRVNIATMQLYRDRRGGLAVMVLESDQPVDPRVVDELRRQPGIVGVTYFNMEETEPCPLDR